MLTITKTTHYITTAEAAKIIGISPDRVCKLVRAGRLTRIGHNVFDKAEVNAFALIPRKPGRKVKDHE